MVSSVQIRRFAWPIILAMVGVVVVEAIAEPALVPFVRAEISDCEAEETEFEVADVVDFAKPNLSTPIFRSPSLYGHFFDDPVQSLWSFSIGHLHRGPPRG